MFVNLLLVNKLTIPFLHICEYTANKFFFRHFVTINMKHSKKLYMVTTMLTELLQTVDKSIVVT